MIKNKTLKHQQQHVEKKKKGLSELNPQVRSQKAGSQF